MAWLKNSIGRIFGRRSISSAQKRAVDGASVLEQVVVAAPATDSPHYGLAAVAVEQRRYRDAAQHYCAGIDSGGASAPAFAGALELQQRQCGRVAVPIYRRLLARDPSSLDVLCNLALALRDDAEYAEACALMEAALKISPDNFVVQYNYATVLADLGELEKSIKLYSGYLARHPEDAGAHVTRGLVRLLNLDFADGWEDYEFRRQSIECRRPFRFPEWDGSDCRGRTLLVYGEQGLGDEIMFASCLPDVLRRADKVIVECEPRLAPLFSRSFPTVQVHARTGLSDTDWLRAAEPIDYQIALGSLPRLFRRALGDFPDHAGYLRADPVRVAYWRERVAKLPGRIKVGVSWRGGNDLTRSHLRSLDIRQLEPLLRVENVSFVNLQYGDVSAECAAASAKLGNSIVQFDDAMHDYDETAALVRALDLVISVQTSIVHLAGALGGPAWTILPFSPEWRYMRSGDRMLWYPSVKLFRQPEPKDWDSVIATITQQLAKHAMRSS